MASQEKITLSKDIDTIRSELEEKGYCIIEGILTKDEIETNKAFVYKWQKTIPNHDEFHSSCNPHNIYKYHEVGQQRFAWLIRTHPKVQEVYKKLLKTEELITSIDGFCFMPVKLNKEDKVWTHTDQAPKFPNLECYQSFVALTSNKERTLVVYEGSHKLHQSYFAEKGMLKESKNWQLIDEKYLEKIKDKKRVLEVKEGSIVLWDSRTFHQNQYGKPNSEERIVQYTCFLPKSHPKNTEAMKLKRRKYFDEKRTTSHWPAPIRVNGKQPRTYGDKSKVIDYSILKQPKLDDLMDEIIKLI